MAKTEQAHRLRNVWKLVVPIAILLVAGIGVALHFHFAKTLPMPVFLRCSLFLTSEPGPSVELQSRWGQGRVRITVGETTRREVESMFSELGYSGKRTRPLLIGPVSYYTSDAGLGYVQVCYWMGRVSAVWTDGDSWILPETLDEMIAAYGYPARVTWTSSYDSRTIIWPEAGILITSAIDI